MKIKLFITTAVTMVAAAAVMLAPAQANHEMGHCDTAVHHPSDPDAFGSGAPNSYACEWWNRWIRVCDRHVDGHRVRAWYNGNLDRPGVDGPWATGWAPSGGCLTSGTSYGAGVITRYRVCVEAEGCSAWRGPHN
jgi:hypothetical protein